MTKLSNITRKLLALALIAVTSSAAVAQNYYDDDIYYDASKSKKEQKTQNKKQVNTNGNNNYYVVGNRTYSQPVADYPSADTYSVPAGSLDMDVDTYNRRGQFLVADSVSVDSTSNCDFAYTQRIERFHNPDIVAGSNDDELQEVYAYAMQQPQNINIYVIDNDPWNYYGPAWSWRYGNPWYWNTWGPSWSWNWGWNSRGWDPYWSWSWSWGWGPSWGWSPGWGPSWGWGPGWGPAWGGPAHAWRPTTPSGSSRPHNPVGSGSMATHRPGSYSPANATGVTNRPGNMGRGRYGSVGTTTSRPGNYVPAGTNNNGSSSSGVRPGNMGRGRSAMTGNSSNSNNRNSYNTNSNNYNYNNNGYRSSSNSNGSFRSSGGSSTRGYSGSHGSVGGGSSRGGGGASRGRR